MIWEKKGLIFCPTGESTSMKSHAAIPFADVIDDRTVRIYFSSRNEQGYSVPYYMDVDSSDLKKIKYLSAPILELGELGTFDECGIMPSWVVTRGDLKYMYYIAWNPQVTVSYRLSIGLAISHDGGLTYKKYSNAPICDRSLNEPYFNTAPCVLFMNDKWRMWYISCTKWHKINNYPEPQYHVKYAESEDGINWLKNGIVCIDYDDDAEAIGRPSVIFEGGEFKMFFSYRKLEGYRSSAASGYQIGYATSKDGINWTKKNDEVGIELSKDGWDSKMIEYCHVTRVKNRPTMFYNGNGFGQTGFGYAEADTF